MTESNVSPASNTPKTPLTAMRSDLLAGFLVFLIALPLCLAIAKASLFPPIAGIWTAVLGGLVATWFSNAQLAIKGPAAGLIVIVAGAVIDLGATFGADLPENERLMLGYRLTLGVGVVAGIVQVLFGLLRAGRLGDFFPLAAVHGLLAAIGIIIFSKQVHVVLGVDPTPDLGPLGLIAEIPNSIRHLNPAIALIGFISLAILFGMPLIQNRFVRRIPSPMIVLLVAVPLGIALNLDHRHTYLFPNSFFDAFGPDGEASQHFEKFEVGPRFLVDMPEVIRNPGAAFAFPEFRGVLTLVGIKYVVLFALIGSLESLLSAKAVDLLDPSRRKTNLDRELTAIGIANTAASFLGGLPMITEIVRSSANITNGAQTRRANFFHGLFLLAFVLFVPNLIHQIPLAALAAMLVFIGFRLAHPYEFLKNWRIGKEQLVVFVVTIVVTLVEDMLLGVLAGVAVEFLLHKLHGVSFRSGWKSSIDVDQPENAPCRITVRDAVVFSNWLQLKSRIAQFDPADDVTIDLSEAAFIDHSVMEKLRDLAREFEMAGGKFLVVGLDDHKSLSKHPLASRKKIVPVAAASSTTATH